MKLTTEASNLRGVRSEINDKTIARFSLSEWMFLFAVTCYCLSLVVSELFGYYHSAGYTSFLYSHGETLSNISGALAHVSEIFLLLLMIFSFFKAKSINIIFLLLCVALFVFQTINESIATELPLMTVLFGSVPTSLILVPLCFYAFQDEDLCMFVQKLAPYLALIALLFSIVSTMRFRLACGWGGSVGAYPGHHFLAMGICFLWVTAIGVARDNKFCSDNKLFFIIAIAILASVIALRRAWVIQAIAILVLSIVLIHPEKRHANTAVLSISAAVVGILFVSYLFPDLFAVWTSRFGEDTRSYQYDQLFSQYSPFSLILGNGATAGYVFHSYANYLFFDNQLLFIAFHFGVFPVILFVSIFINVIASSKKSGRSSYMLISIVLLYLAAILGLSTYFAIELTPGIFALFAMFGSSKNLSSTGQTIAVRGYDVY